MAENSAPNYSIRCNIKSCTNHFKSQDYCALDVISVGSNDKHVQDERHTDCLSFVRK